MPFIVTFPMRNGSKGYLKPDAQTWTFKLAEAGKWDSNETAIRVRRDCRQYFPRKTAWNKTTIEVVK